MERENKRTLFEKLREAALAYHLTREWSKEKILTEYLNSVYFGNGAYGIESVARTYFSADHPGCGETPERPCAKERHPRESRCWRGSSRTRPASTSWPTRRRPASVATSCCPRCASRARSRRRSTRSSSRRRSWPRTRSTRPRRRRRRPPPHHDLGAPAGGGPLRPRPLVPGWPGRSRRRSISTTRRPPRPRCRSGSAIPTGRPRPSSSSTTAPAASGRWSVGATTTRRPSTWPRRASASRVPASSLHPRARALEDGHLPELELAVAEARVPRAGNQGSRSSSSTTTRGPTPVSARWPRRRRTPTTRSSRRSASRSAPKRVAKLAKRMGIRTPVSHNLAMTLGGLRRRHGARYGLTPTRRSRRARQAGPPASPSRRPRPGRHQREVRRGDKVLDTNKIVARRIIPTGPPTRSRPSARWSPAARAPTPS